MMRFIGVESDWIGYFDGHGPDPCFESHAPERLHHDLVKRRHAPRFEVDGFHCSLRGVNDKVVSHEIEGHRE